ncbi:MAG: D-alanyl-D-alanine carboxypeptidase/D-alanyl-D-alanine-endopeptidase [Deltaproteobacteria bacterium]|nr:D-alanyl-D-alanine carboxypeptidase/D-alanyl-D-alanine-endopeptidase [Deltaproteobacteria bacterium]
MLRIGLFLVLLSASLAPRGAGSQPPPGTLATSAPASAPASVPASAVQIVPPRGDDELLSLSPLLDPEVREVVSRALTQPALRGARLGLHAVSLTTGAVLLDKNSQLLLNPASNAKLATTAAALSLLGPEYRYHTLYASEGEVVGKQLRGNLYVQGRGDPTITTERLLAIVHELKLLGIEKIEGRIIVDDSYFDDQREPSGWEQEEGDRAYLAPTGALSLNHNTVTLYVRPGPVEGAPAQVVVDPPSDYVELENRVTTTRWETQLYMRSWERSGKNRVRLLGRIGTDQGPRRIYRRSADPGLHFGSALAGVLNAAGIKVSSAVRRGLMPDRARSLYIDRSPRLAEIVDDLNKWSNNFIAEQLIKTLGAEVGGKPGSFAHGLAAVHGFLEAEVGFAAGSYVFENGSGLNDVNRFTPEQLTRLLAYMYRHPEAGAEYVTSLGVAGAQGTIASRLRHTAAERRLRAKTGTLTGVSALSGYVVTAAGEAIAFSIMVNGISGRIRPILEVQDMIGEALALNGGASQMQENRLTLQRRSR